MSSGIKRPLAEADRDASAFARLFAGCFTDWRIAGSVRRKVHNVGDVEHVVVPLAETIPGDGLFGGSRVVNSLWRRADELLAAGKVSKHCYGASGFRWGEKYRGFDFRDFAHEIFTATESNFGPTLAIRTGPAEFSKRLVTGLLSRSYRNHEGHVWRCQWCPNCDRNRKLGCLRCDNTGLVCVERIPVPTEEEYFKLAGTPWLPPERREFPRVETGVQA